MTKQGFFGSFQNVCWDMVRSLFFLVRVLIMTACFAVPVILYLHPPGLVMKSFSFQLDGIGNFELISLGFGFLTAHYVIFTSMFLASRHQEKVGPAMLPLVAVIVLILFPYFAYTNDFVALYHFLIIEPVLFGVIFGLMCIVCGLTFNLFFKREFYDEFYEEFNVL